jgi:hypothetical protein
MQKPRIATTVPAQKNDDNWINVCANSKADCRVQKFLFFLYLLCLEAVVFPDRSKDKLLLLLLLLQGRELFL